MLEVKQIVPYKNEIEDHFIFESNFPLLGDNLTYYLNGHERRKLSGRPLAKWDYFFRASPYKLSRDFEKD